MLKTPCGRLPPPFLESKTNHYVAREFESCRSSTYGTKHRYSIPPVGNIPWKRPAAGVLKVDVPQGMDSGAQSSCVTNLAPGNGSSDILPSKLNAESDIWSLIMSGATPEIEFPKPSRLASLKHPSATRTLLRLSCSPSNILAKP